MEMDLNEKEIQDNIVTLIENETNTVKPKKSFCRFYLRGLCVYDADNCKFSHGVQDLDYSHWTQDQIVEYDYLKDVDFCQKNTIKGPRIYKNLYDFQTQKVFTLDQLNEDRPKRSLVRNTLHKKLYEQFLNLLQKTYPDALFSQDFLIRQYTRVGFNKLMSRIKFSHLTSYLCQQKDRYYKASLIMPPHVKKQRSFIVKKAKDHIIDNFYKDSYNELIKNHNEQTIDEGKIKKFLFNQTRIDLSIPPLNTHLKNKKISFPIYIKTLLGEDIQELQIKFQADTQTLLNSAKQFLQKKLCQSMVQWNDVYKYLAKQHQLNNGNILNQVKPLLVKEGFQFLYFPTNQIIVHPNIEMKIKFQGLQECPCNFKQKYNKQQLLMQAMNWQKKLPPKQSLDIFDLQSLLNCAPSILQSKILGVDLQGRLRKNGYIQMIQLNNGINTFLIDIYRMDLNGDVEAFELTKKVLRNVMMDKGILKIFHDCRHDSLALHEFMNSCVSNIFDTSASETYRGQLQVYHKLKEVLQKKVEQKEDQKFIKQKQKKAKQALSQCNNVKTPGLNEILKRYNAPHGINKNKQLFHSMWSKGQTSLFDQRPLDPEFRQYCIKDVLDLPHVYQEMTSQQKNKEKWFNLDIAMWLGSQYIKYGFLCTEQGENKQ